jgi:hypothetical protein
LIAAPGLALIKAEAKSIAFLRGESPHACSSRKTQVQAIAFLIYQKKMSLGFLFRRTD